MSYSSEPSVATPSGASPAEGRAEPPPRNPSTGGGEAPSPAMRPIELPELDPSALVRSDPDEPNAADNMAELQRARADAHQSGFEEGRKAEAMRVGTAIEAVKAIVAELGRKDDQRRQEASERIAVLATAIAGHLVEREVRSSPEVIADLVRRAVAEFPVNDPLRVHLNPSDLAHLSSGLADEAGREHLTSGQSVRWIPDPAIRSGGCLVEGSEQVVDARLSQALERISRVLIHG